MSHRPAVRRPLAWLVPSLVAGIAAAVVVQPVSARQPAAIAEPAAGGLVVPPLPEGTPEQLLEFVSGLMPPKAQPKSREEALSYLRGVAGVSVQAADKILAGVKSDDPLYAKAATLKLESLMRLAQFGDEQAAEEAPGYSVPDELPAPDSYEVGTIAMANTGSPDTGGGQWFIITGAQGVALPPQYTIIGTVTKGLDTTVKVLAGLADPLALPSGVPPLSPIDITSITIDES